MHSVVRTVKARGAPLSRALHTSTTTTSTTTSSQTTALLLLKPSKALAKLSSHTSSATSHYFSTAASAARQTQRLSMPMAHTSRILWAQRFYNSKSYSTSTTGGSSSVSATIQELEQLLAKNDFKGFQEASAQAISSSAKLTGTSAPVTKELYHFLLKTLGERPQAFTAVITTTGAAEQEVQEILDPLNSAIGILTDMSREANVLGKAEVQPDRETLRLVLEVAGRTAGGSDWESARMLVEAVRHGRLPAVLSLDQWELPDLDFPLDQVLWKSMFECIHSAAAGAGAAGVQKEVDVMMFLMADQLTRTQDIDMDDALWGYVLQAFGKAGSAAKLNDLLPRLPAIEKTSGGVLYSNVAEALANCGLTGQAAEVMSTLSRTLDTLPSIRPFTALARQHAKRGNYEAIIADEKMWATKGQKQDDSPESRALLTDFHRSSLEASAVALDRLVKTVSKTFKDRQSDTLPDQVLAGMVSPAQLNRYQYSEATFLWARRQDTLAAIPKADLTAEDYDTLMRISTRLNLLLPKRCSLQNHALTLLTEMKQQGIQPLKSTYMTLMETMARTREYGASREDGSVAKKVMKVFEEMTAQKGYAADSPKDFLPLLESCFGMYSHSPFVAGQWMYSNQLYPVAKDALKTVEQMMRKALTTDTQDDNNNSSSSKDFNVQQYHDRDTIANVLAGLAHGDEVKEIWQRWDDLALQGVERDAMLYQTIISASHGQEKMAQYVLEQLRYSMLKEQPAIQMTPEIFEGLLNCCIRVQDATSARSLISQCTSSGVIQKTAEWYAPMVKTCLMVEGLEEEGGFLLEEMRRNEMAMDTDSGAFLEFLMGYFVNKRGDYAAGQEMFKSYLKSEQRKVEKLVAESKAQRAKGNNKSSSKGGVVEMSERELVWRSEKWSRPVEHLVEKVDLSPTTAVMLNLLVLAQIRERAQMLELEKRSGFGAGSKDRMRDAQLVMHYLTGETKSPSSSAATAGSSAASTIPDAAAVESSSPSISTSSSSPSLLFNSSTTVSSPSTFQPASPTTSSTSASSVSNKSGSLLFVNKYVLGEYIDTCIRDGSAELLEEADWALNKVMPRVIGQQRMAKDTQRLRQALENARHRAV
ncbi:hypothetical protein BGZ95_011216 [Linnemannia exigua]|uniref:Uncharacterized protein n=1 Tax=Linnemannia exigua TaxID=604196 RepID=A0AAD4H5T6_9FUNG|nr:hypothetical protein BGZ95_011216 [Linnemannia exigua]